MSNCLLYERSDFTDLRIKEKLVTWFVTSPPLEPTRPGKLHVGSRENQLKESKRQAAKQKPKQI